LRNNAEQVGMLAVVIGPLAGALVSLLALVVISILVEALRRAPKPPKELIWVPGIPERYADLDGVKVRYIKCGTGPNLVLLHTLRTQLDLFEKMVPELANSAGASPK
jgi:hypothetical protein